MELEEVVAILREFEGETMVKEMYGIELCSTILGFTFRQTKVDNVKREIEVDVRLSDEYTYRGKEMNKLEEYMQLNLTTDKEEDEIIRKVLASHCSKVEGNLFKRKEDIVKQFNTQELIKIIKQEKYYQ